MLGANLVCFQTYSYSRHFTSSCVRVCGYEVAARGIDVQGHVTAVMHTPVGVDADRVSRDLSVFSYKVLPPPFAEVSLLVLVRAFSRN